MDSYPGTVSLTLPLHRLPTQWLRRSPPNASPPSLRRGVYPTDPFLPRLP
ncbi:hypothetical protein Ais01nite_70320 [Asanoa ishikariensis]|nr:hypothetical protein Ais01nite_70320 [Asanoa ishikariensis]